ncbi:MAG TPA: hypothetical protein VFZ59_02655 [Verrucomicrobiae bacterium]|nr:hypothetical protein [Verrucomicrobiae bacterium]
MNAAPEKENRSTVVVIYDDPITRARALTACDYLVGELWENVELDFHWWRTDFLDDANMSRAAAKYAIDADFLIICSSGAEHRSRTLEAWLESWIQQRDKNEGALIDLSLLPDSTHRLQSVLREIAERGKFDYLASSESSRSNRSTGKLASVLPASTERLIDRSHRPSRFGLNE